MIGEAEIFGQPCTFGSRFHVDGELQNGGRVKKGRTAVFSSGVGSLEEIFTAMGPDHNDTPDENHAELDRTKFAWDPEESTWQWRVCEIEQVDDSVMHLRPKSGRDTRGENTANSATGWEEDSDCAYPTKGTLLPKLWLSIKDLRMTNSDKAHFDHTVQSLRGQGDLSLTYALAWSVEKRTIHEAEEYWRSDRLDREFHSAIRPG